MKIHPRLKTILTFNFVLMAALPILIVGFITLKILTRSLTQQITQQNYLLAKSLAGEVERFLNEPYSLLGQVEEIIGKNGLIETEHIDEYLETVIRHYSFFAMIQVLDRDGFVTHVAPLSKNYLGINVSGQSSYKATVTHRQPYWSPTFISMQTGEPTLALTRLFKQGMLVGYLNLASLNNIADRIKIGSHGYATIVDQEGTTIAHPDRSMVAERLNVKNMSVIREGLAGKEGTFRFFSKGVEELGSVAVVTQTGWLVVVLQPVEEAFAPVARIKSIFLVGAAGAVILALGLALLSMKKTLDPLSQLVASTRKIAEGDYDFPSQRESYPEIDRLARDFETMTQAIKSREQALRESEERLAKINDCFLSFGTDPLENINRLTMLCGELMGAACALYNRLDRGMLSSWGQWRTPPDYDPVDKPDGHICYDVIKHTGNEVLVVDNLPETHYAQTDPNVTAYALKTYVGRAVRLCNANVGSLCVVYQDEFAPSESDKKIMEIIASAIGVEEERKRVEAAFRESEEKYRHLVESTSDWVWTCDMEGRQTFTNNAVEKILGYEIQEVLGAPHFSLVHSEDRARIQKWFKELVAQKKGWQGTAVRWQHKDGTARFLEGTAQAVLDAEGNLLGFTGMDRDVTERQRAEEERQKLEAQLQRAQKMEAIGALAGGVAHDLNNILSGLVSYPELLLMDIPEDSPLRKPIMTIQRSGERAAAIVQDLLTLARRGVAVTEVVSLNAIISDFLKTPEYNKLRRLHPGVEVKVDLDPDLLNILGSPIHLSKTLMNLVANAAEAIPNDGKIFISTANQYIDKPVRGYDYVEEGDYVVLSVSDSGVGIPPEDLERIFEPFYTKKVLGRSGTGLGMAVIWGTVKDHKGYIDVQSIEGKSTRFDLFFPITRQEPVEKGTVIPISQYMGSESILIVDDVEEQREIATQILTKLGYSVTAVASGEEAIEYVKNNSVDLVILDMIMDPGIDGLDTYRGILNHHPGQKAIITSGFSETERVRETQRLGAGGYIKKPYVLETLGLAVRDELDK